MLSSRLIWYIQLAETNLLPDCLLRAGVRASLIVGILKKRLKPFAKRKAEKSMLIEKLKNSPVAIETNQPNIQHYEVPSEFFKLVLGPQLKYSCCYWPAGVDSLEEAEEAMLALTAERAQLRDGMEILDLGCGWGAFSLWAALRFPAARITAITNSKIQKAFIDHRSQTLKLSNIKTKIADIANLHVKGKFDRIVSIEMFEHMKNYRLLLAYLNDLLKPNGKLFVHIFSNIDTAHEFDASNPKNWMARTFFTGGTMPSDDLLFHFQEHLIVENHWRLNGLHYSRTLNAWLKNMYSHKEEILPILAETYGKAHKKRWWVNWKLFFLGCAETWGIRWGNEFMVSHYLFSKLGS